MCTYVYLIYLVRYRLIFFYLYCMESITLGSHPHGPCLALSPLLFPRLVSVGGIGKDGAHAPRRGVVAAAEGTAGRSVRAGDERLVVRRRGWVAAGCVKPNSLVGRVAFYQKI